MLQWLTCDGSLPVVDKRDSEAASEYVVGVRTQSDLQESWGQALGWFRKQREANCLAFLLQRHRGKSWSCVLSSCTNNKCKGELRRCILVVMFFQVPISEKTRALDCLQNATVNTRTSLSDLRSLAFRAQSHRRVETSTGSSFLLLGKSWFSLGGKKIWSKALKHISLSFLDRMRMKLVTFLVFIYYRDE